MTGFVILYFFVKNENNFLFGKIIYILYMLLFVKFYWFNNDVNYY